MSRRIVLTGATHGCGRALVERFIEDGHTVAGCGRSADRVRELNRLYRAPQRFDVVDVADSQGVDAWARSVLADGTPELVINNAGLINANAPLWEVSAAEFEHVVDVNLCGTAAVMRAFLPAMIERGAGVVVNMSSGWGRSTAPEVAPYCATKWAVEGLSQAVAQEVPQGLAVLAVNPGVIRTRMLESCFGESASQHPTPEDWAVRAAPFLLGLGPRDTGRALNVP